MPPEETMDKILEVFIEGIEHNISENEDGFIVLNDQE